MVPDDDDKRVKDLLDPAQLADLEKWFGLPSFHQLEEQGAPEGPSEDEEMREVRKRRDAAMAAVDPALLAKILDRFDQDPEEVIEFRALIDVRVREDVGLFDERMVDKGFSIAEPREVEISEDLRDDLKECTPQALLRDLHRPETDFAKTFEIVDAAADQRFDIVAAVAEAMRTSWTLQRLDIAPLAEVTKLIADARSDRYRSWTHALAGLPNRKVTE